MTSTFSGSEPDWLRPLPVPNPVPELVEGIDPALLEAFREVARREKAFTALRHFAPHYAGFEPAAHHVLICDAIDDLIHDRIDVLVVMSPPASAKSSYVSIAAPAYIIGRDPTARIISVSRAAELASEFGGRVKNIVESTAYQLASPVRIAQDTRAKDNWKTTEGGSYFAVGAAGGVLGKRADYVIADDIHTSFEDAQSESQLNRIRNWFESDLLSRLTPQGKLIVIGQRLNANDIIGYTLQRSAENPETRIRVLKFTAEATPDVTPEHPDLLGRTVPGERMWPEFYTDKYLADRKRDAFIWRTLWMQEPPSSSGDWVSASEVRIIDPEDAPPPTAPTYIAADLALSINSGDYTVHLVARTTHDLDLCIVDARRSRTSIEDSADTALALCETYTPLEYLIDDDNASRVFVPLLARTSRDTNRHIPYKAMPLRGQDKETRAAAIRGWFKRGKVSFVRAHWNEWLVREVMTFPNAMGDGVDDGIDCLSLFGRRLAAMARPSPLPTTITRTILRPNNRTATLAEMFDDRERQLRHRRF